MKLRIFGSNIRLRLSKTEVERFKNGNGISNQLTFPNGNSLTYRLAEGTDNTVSYDHDVITIVLCEQEVEIWANSDQVGIKAQIPMDNGNTIGVLVEKDFQCLTNKEEDQSDFYPNPKDSH